MCEGFDWVPFYEELVPKLAAFQYNQAELVTLLQVAGVNGLADQQPRGVAVPLTVMDPFTFLSLINKQSHPEREKILRSLKAQLSLRAEVPKEYSGIPKADPRQAWLFAYEWERHPDDLDKLWTLYKAVLSTQPVSDDVFEAAQQVKFAGRAKLTQAIFRAAPSRFFPVDGQTTSYLARLGLSSKYSNATEYQNICASVRQRVNKPLYMQSHDAWAANQRTPGVEACYQQAVLKKACSTSAATHKEPAGGVKLPRLKESGASQGGYQRDPKVAAAALIEAQFQCEIDPQHPTFVSRVKGKPYVEAHHLVPLSIQARFEFSLDVKANVVALCPNCHRRLHHGTDHGKRADLVYLFKKRRLVLAEKEIKLSESELLACYHGDILEDDV